MKFSEEGKFDAVTAISGSGPPPFFHCRVDDRVGVNLGLSHDEAFKLVKHTIDGAEAYSQFSIGTTKIKGKCN